MSNQQVEQDWLHDNALNILDSVVDAILTIDEEGMIGFVNQATEDMFHYSAEELIGQPVTMLMPEPYKSQHQQFLRNFLDGRDAKIIGIGRELSAVTREGDVFPVYLAVNEIKTGERSYFAGIVRDLSEQKEAQEALLEQRERLARVGRLSTMGEMTASIAHEINQPLTAISAYSQACMKLLEKDDYDVTRVLDGLRKLNEQSLRAGAVIERIQRFVRHEGSEKKLVDINALIRDLLHLAEADARLHSIDLHFELENGLPEAYCDPVQIQQVALNLIRNAIDAMLEVNCAHGADVIVSTRRCDEGIEVAVIDLGTGVTEENEPLVFSPFHTTKAEGMGMGLSICRSIVRHHGGDLNFVNNAARVDAGIAGAGNASLQHGCTFYFRLPIEGVPEDLD
jgi:two-component system sensor kinase FixL